MRLVLVGGNSFIAHHVAAAARLRDIETLQFGHDEDVRAALQRDDTVVNCALVPVYRTSPYREDQDFDLTVARMAHDAKARFVMLSTRRVYPTDSRWNARESGPAGGDETAYGRNKAQTEAGVNAVLGDRCLVLRLSNVFGFEFDRNRTRPSFLGMLLGSLAREGVIRFDMHPDTRRDFIPVETCAGALVQRVLDGSAGTFNLGCGFPVRCGSLADWICEGFGTGELLVNPAIVRDEFFLDMGHWKERFGSLIDVGGLKSYCVNLGRSLACAKS